MKKRVILDSDEIMLINLALRNLKNEFKNEKTKKLINNTILKVNNSKTIKEKL